MIFIELLSGVISGMILFQTAIVAPVVFTTLDVENASKFLRKINNLSVIPHMFVYRHD